jgi:hypothetical protein
MGQRLDFNRAQGPQSPVSGAFKGAFQGALKGALSGQGILVQAIACQIALPAIATEPCAIPLEGCAIPLEGFAIAPITPQTASEQASDQLKVMPVDESAIAPAIVSPLASPPVFSTAPPTSLIPLPEPTEAYSFVSPAETQFVFSPDTILIEPAIEPALEPEIEPQPKQSDLPPPILLAGPQDLNPSLSRPPVALPSVPVQNSVPVPSVLPAEPALPVTTDSPLIESPITNLENQTESQTNSQAAQPFVEWTGLEVGFESDFNRSSENGQARWSWLPTVQGQLANGNTVGISVGFSQFEQANVETVEHIPLTFSWQGDVSPVELNISGGVDLFNRLPSDTHFSAKATILIGSQAQLAMTVEQGPYAFNATTLENNIAAWHYGPDIFWQITPKTSFFSKLRLGNYSDGNGEEQSFSRLERQVGDSANVSLNLFNQSFQQSLEDASGYFSPFDFVVATAEMAWQEEVTQSLSCGLLGSLGQQRLAGEWALAYTAQALCSVDITLSSYSQLQLDLGYRFSNVSKNQSALVDDNAYTDQQIIAGIKVRF